MCKERVNQIKCCW